jgi:hypothetical protein
LSVRDSEERDHELATGRIRPTGGHARRTRPQSESGLFVILAAENHSHDETEKADERHHSENGWHAKLTL